MREKVSALAAANDAAAAESVREAAEVAAALARAEDLEEEAESLRVLNARLADAAEDVAAMAVTDDTASASAEERVARLENEAAAARAALVEAEARAKTNRDALLRRVRALEIDLAETEDVRDSDAAAAVSLAEARGVIESFAASGRIRDDALLQAKAEAAAAAEEVVFLKARLAASSDDAAARNAAAAQAWIDAWRLDSSGKKIRALETLVAETRVAEEAAEDASAEEAAALVATLRHLETAMAEMVDPEDMDAVLRRLRAAETRMAEMVDPEDMDAVLRRLRAAETRMAEMVDVQELVAADSRAARMEEEADALRAKVRALETQMASMSRHDDVDDAGEATGAPHSETKDIAAYALNAAAAQAWIDAWITSRTAPKTFGSAAFARDPKARFTRRPFTFPASTRAEKIPKRSRSPSEGTAGRSGGNPRACTSSGAVTYTFDVAPAETERRFARASPESFILRKFAFSTSAFGRSGVRATSGTAFERSPGGSRAPIGLVRTDTDAEREMAVDGGDGASFGAFARSGRFKLRRFDFIEAKAKAKKRFSRGDFGSSKGDAGGFKRAPGWFTLRRFKFHP